MAGLGKYSTGGYGRIGVYRVNIATKLNQFMKVDDQLSISIKVGLYLLFPDRLNRHILSLKGVKPQI